MEAEIRKSHVRHWLIPRLLLVMILVLLGNAESAKLKGPAGPTGWIYYQYMAGLAKIVHDVYPDMDINLSPGGAVSFMMIQYRKIM